MENVSERPDKNINEQIIKEQGMLDRIGVITQEITPQRLANIFLAAENGNLGELYEYFTKIMYYDTRIQGLISKRKKAPSRYNWSIANNSTHPKASEIAEMLDKQYKRIQVKKLYRDIMDGAIYGLTGFENIFYKEGDNLFMKRPKQISQSRLRQHNDSFMSEIWGRPYFVNKSENDRVYFELSTPKYKTFYSSYDPKLGYFDLVGIMRPVAKWYVLKYYVIKYFAQYTESYGFPISTLQMSEEQYKKYKGDVDRFLASIKRGKVGVYFDGMVHKIVSVADSGNANIFHTFLQYADTEIAIGVAGQNLSTEVIKGGSYAATTSHLEIEQEIISDDCEYIDDELNENVSLPFILLNYDIQEDEARAIKIVTKVPKKVNVKDAEIRYDNAAKYGIEVSRRQFKEDFGIRDAISKEDKMILKISEKYEPKKKEKEQRPPDERDDGGSVADD